MGSDPDGTGILTGTWTLLGKGGRTSAAAVPPSWPGPRGHHSLVTLGQGSGADVGVLLFGGALCIPGCSCYNDTWVWQPEAGAFSMVEVRPARAARTSAACCLLPRALLLPWRSFERKRAQTM